ncbi:hypothetical protein QWJ06_04610 [Kocuria rhizophila]|uniref:hypothetical protein n=1 Tax=Kocuria rhizophila TaxID=72000 RepID=UPI0025B091C2|nr:hypothetical protein [Kocuria rhizophila]MDN3225997.1 hypothetical protein [Kocuria rhizophila]
MSNSDRLISKLDEEYADLRRKVDRAIKWGLPDPEIEDLTIDCTRFMTRAKRARYHVVGMRVVESFLKEPHRIPTYVQLSTPRSANNAPNPITPGLPNRRTAKAISQPKPSPSSNASRNPNRPNTPDPFSSTFSPHESSCPPRQSPASAGDASEKGESSPTPSDVAQVVGKSLLRRDAPVKNLTPKLPTKTVRESLATYRTFLTAQSHVPVDQILSVVQKWVDEKHYGVDVQKSETWIDKSGQCWVETSRMTDDVNMFRLRVVETKPGGDRYTTTIMVGSDNFPWVWIDIHNDQNQYVAVPRVAKYLLGEFDFYSGTLRMDSKASRIGPEDVDDLIGTLRDRQRRVPIILAGSDHSDDMIEVFEQGLKEWGKQVFGLGGVAILDPDATKYFNKVVGNPFAVSAWSLRTYLPDVEFDIPESAHKHRFLGTSRLVEERPGRVAARLGDFARQASATMPAPHPVLDAINRFERESLTRLSQGLQIPASEKIAAKLQKSKTAEKIDLRQMSSMDDSEIRNRVAQTLEWLDIPSLDEAHLMDIYESILFKKNAPALEEVTERLAEYELENSRYREDLEFNKVMFLEYEADLAQSMELEREQRQKILRLQSRLSEFIDAEAAYSDGPEMTEPESPRSMEELLDRLVALESDGVYFTGDPKITSELDKYDSNGAIVGAAWECLLVCCDYIRAKIRKDFTGSMFHYLQKQPPGYRFIPPSRHAAWESETTMNQYGRLRIFGVPRDIDASGSVSMPAHFKLVKVGMISPRMHYYDNVDVDGRIFIGYIGPHLRTDGTN